MPMQYNFNTRYKVNPARKKSIDVDGNNSERADAVQHALNAFLELIPTDEENQTILGDFLCNARHWAERNGVDFDAAIRNSEMHWQAETGRAPY